MGVIGSFNGGFVMAAVCVRKGYLFLVKKWRAVRGLRGFCFFTALALAAAGVFLYGCGGSGGRGEDGEDGGSVNENNNENNNYNQNVNINENNNDNFNNNDNTNTNGNNNENNNGNESVGGEDYRGEVLFEEFFQDTDFESREWYDVTPDVEITSQNPPPEGDYSFVCNYPQGGTSCAGGVPKRRRFPETDSLYFSYWVRYDENWVGSDRPYHPHEFHFTTNADGVWIGPAFTYLTAYVENVGGYPRIALQDSKNVDLDCILRNDDSFVGCDGSFDDYTFTEERSVCACNGLMGDLDGRDCFPYGSGWYSARFWDSPVRVFDDEPGVFDKTEWSFVEVFLKMNDIVDGAGVPNGMIRLWVDGELFVSYDQILMRTGALPDLAFEQFILAPYIGDGSPVDQTTWIGNITVARGVLP